MDELEIGNGCIDDPWGTNNGVVVIPFLHEHERSSALKSLERSIRSNSCRQTLRVVILNRYRRPCRSKSHHEIDRCGNGMHRGKIESTEQKISVG